KALGGDVCDAITAIGMAIKAKTENQINIRVISCSWGCYPNDPDNDLTHCPGRDSGCNDSLCKIIQYAGEKDIDILFVASAGNSEQDNDQYPHYPSSYNLPNLIAVAATDNDDDLYTDSGQGSNYGKNSVCLTAPGSAIWSTSPSHGICDDRPYRFF